MNNYNESKWLEENFTKNEKHLYKIKDILVKTSTKYQKMEVLDIENYKRALVLDGEIQSTELDEFIYHESIVHPAMVINAKASEVLVLGGGEGATIREILKYKNVKKVVMVDIDDSVINFAKKYLEVFHKGSFEDSRVKLVIDDANKYLSETSEKFDVVISDLPCPIENTPIIHLYSIEFFEKIKKVLKPGGAVVIQSTPSDIPQFEIFSAINRTLREIFSFVYPFSSFVPSSIITWGYNLCSDIELKNIFDINYVDDFLEKNLLKNDLRYYDGITNIKMFSFPKHLRKILENETNILKKDNLKFLFK